jgi:hypothetical protein
MHGSIGWQHTHEIKGQLCLSYLSEPWPRLLFSRVCTHVWCIRAADLVCFCSPTGFTTDGKDGQIIAASCGKSNACLPQHNTSTTGCPGPWAGPQRLATPYYGAAPAEETVKCPQQLTPCDCTVLLPFCSCACRFLSEDPRSGSTVPTRQVQSRSDNTHRRFHLSQGVQKWVWRLRLQPRFLPQHPHVLDIALARAAAHLHCFAFVTCRSAAVCAWLKSCWSQDQYLYTTL